VPTYYTVQANWDYAPSEAFTELVGVVGTKAAASTLAKEALTDSPPVRGFLRRKVLISRRKVGTSRREIATELEWAARGCLTGELVEHWTSTPCGICHECTGEGPLPCTNPRIRKVKIGR
jgi:hypothetical protein